MRRRRRRQEMEVERKEEADQFEQKVHPKWVEKYYHP
jgi:hypothetical protein